MLASLGFKAAFYVHAAFSVPTLLILLRFNPKKKDAPKKPPKFGELYQLVTRDPDVMVSEGGGTPDIGPRIFFFLHFYFLFYDQSTLRLSVAPFCLFLLT